MKKVFLYFPLFCFHFATAQMGVGTINPSTDLHVVGDMLVQDTFTIGTLSTISPTDEDFTLITRIKNGTVINGELTTLDVNALSVAPVNTIDYHFVNIDMDNLADMDLQYDTTKYIVAVSNFRYVGDALQKVDVNGTKKSIGQFVVQTFQSGGTWHLEIQNRTLDLLPGGSIEYYVTLVVYDKSYYKNLPSIYTDMQGGFTGTASSVPNLN